MPGERLRWWHHPETMVCGFRDHVAPVRTAKAVLPEHGAIATTTSDGRRLARCLRCDAWLDAPLEAATIETLAPLRALELPRRGKRLRDAVVVRLISVDRAIHCVIFGLAALGLWLLEAHLPGLQRTAGRLTDTGNGSLAGPGQTASRDVITRQLQHLLHLRKHGLLVLAVTATIYAVLEGTEAVGLWWERRWAEYLTALATAGFLPFEVHELAKRVTAVRVGALILNGAVLVWLLWRKHLFGLGRGHEEQAEDPLDRYRNRVDSSGEDRVGGSG
jgi:uncharacterized membrane protein (DUF2068 family)